MNEVAIVIGDADALIALINTRDLHHEKALVTSQKLSKLDFEVIFPSTSFVEAATTLKRKMNQPEAVETLLEYYQKKFLTIEFIDSSIFNYSLKLYNPTGSKKNTLFDAIVAATAHHYQTKYIFSFDTWYTKIGFQLYN